LGSFIISLEWLQVQLSNLIQK